MQLTKDDVEWINGVKYISVYKFQRVRKFYEDYKDNSLKFKQDYPEVYNHFIKQVVILFYNDWLFNYCFVEGLK